MNKQWFKLLAGLIFLAVGFGNLQLVIFFTGAFIVSGIGYLIQRWDEKRIGKRTVQIKRELPTVRDLMRPKE